MVDEQHLALLKQGPYIWRDWRARNPQYCPDLSHAGLERTRLHLVDLSWADLSWARLHGADLSCASLERANLSYAGLCNANLEGAYLADADLSGACLHGARLYRADLSGATLIGANLYVANLSGANLSRVDLRHANLIETSFAKANLDSCSVYGISVWNANLKGATQSNLVVTYPDIVPTITVDNLEVAQFVHLLLNNDKIRDVINTVGKKAVLILGQFTERKNILDALRYELRERGYLPIVFDFERPAQRDFTETVMTLAGMCLFIIADITKPRSVPLELQATVPNYMIPFVPIIEKGEQPFSMFQDLWQKHHWVLDPLRYNSIAELKDLLDQAVIEPAKRRRDELEARKAEALIIRDIQDYR